MSSLSGRFNLEVHLFPVQTLHLTRLQISCAFGFQCKIKFTVQNIHVPSPSQKSNEEKEESSGKKKKNKRIKREEDEDKEENEDEEAEIGDEDEDDEDDAEEEETNDKIKEIKRPKRKPDEDESDLDSSRYCLNSASTDLSLWVSLIEGTKNWRIALLSRSDDTS